MRDPNELDPRRVEELLSELRARLNTRGIVGSLHVVGGAALALRYPEDRAVRVTRDIDALYWPKGEVEAVAEEMGREHDLPLHWLNDRARSFAPVTERRDVTDTFEVSIAEADELVAMKLAASREQDLADLEILARHIGIADAEEMVEIAYRFYGSDSIPLNETREEYMLIARDVMKRARRAR